MTNKRLGILCWSLVVAGLILMAASLIFGLGTTLYVLGCLMIVWALLALVIWFDDQE